MALAFPHLLVLLASWLLMGLVATRGLLGLRDGLQVSVLALPLGLLSHVLLVNAAAYALFLPAVVLCLTLCGLLVSLLWLWRAQPAPLEWSLGPGARAAALSAVVAVGVGAWALHSRAYYVDDAGHAAMANLLATGHFPLRLPCNPSLRNGYHYGPNLLAAEVEIVTGLGPFAAVNVVKALAVTSVLMLAFVAGWQSVRRVAAGSLAVALLITAGPMLWFYLPLAQEGVARWIEVQQPALVPLVASAQLLASDPWHLTILTPGSISPNFAAAQRAMAWTFAPFQILLVLALMEIAVAPQRRAFALAAVLGATGLMQPGALLILAPACALYATVLIWRGLSGRGFDRWTLGALAVAATLVVVQGGPVTDSLLDRLQGVVNPSTGFTFSPWRFPSCRSLDAPDLTCVLLSVGNLGLVPFLLPWIALHLWRLGHSSRLILACGCAAAYLFPFFFRFDFFDWNIQRSITFATWTLAVLLAEPLYALLRARGARRWLGAALIVVVGLGGLLELGVVVDGRYLQDESDLSRWSLGALDEQIAARWRGHLPRSSLVFDPKGCVADKVCRPAVLFGCYGASAREAVHFRKLTPTFARLLTDPTPEALRGAGYTHLYLDADWLKQLGPRAAAGLGRGLELLQDATTPTDTRALLRVCDPGETCALDVARLERP
jgi:hypothetical protein